MHSAAGAFSLLLLLAMLVAVSYAPARHPLLLFTVQVAADNSSSPAVSLYEAPVQVLFVLPALLGALHGFSSARLAQTDAPYGEHGIAETLGWETGFWTFVGAQHALVQCVMCSPLDVYALAGATFAMTVLLLAFCTAAVNAESESPSRRLEFPAVLLGCALYTLMGALTHTAPTTALSVWTAHALLHFMLVGGHLSENPVTFTTVLNCRWTYTLLACALNIVLYAVY